MSSNVNQDVEDSFVEWSGTFGGIGGTGSVWDGSFSWSEEISSTIGVEVEALGSSVLVVINMLVMSTYSNSESVEGLAEIVDEEKEDGFDSDGLDSYIVSSLDQKMSAEQHDNGTDP